MDIYQTIRQLVEERDRLDAIIERLERQQISPRVSVAPKRRGRKGMTREERLEVSERMRRYWEEKRKAAAAAGSTF